MALTPHQDRLNRALDGLLSEEELAQVDALMRADPGDARRFHQMQAADQALQTPPMAAAPPNFAANVMAAIQAGKHQVYVEEPRVRSFLWFGLALGTIIALPLVIFGLAAFGQAIGDSAVLSTLLQDLGQTLTRLVNFATGVLNFLGSFFTQFPVIPALLLTLIPLALVWGWLVWWLQQRSRPPTITVKVQVRSAS